MVENRKGNVGTVTMPLQISGPPDTPMLMAMAATNATRTHAAS